MEHMRRNHISADVNKNLLNITTLKGLISKYFTYNLSCRLFQKCCAYNGVYNYANECLL